MKLLRARSRLRGQRVFFAFLVGLLFVSAVSAATYYVSPEGNDSHGGDIEWPFATIPRAQAAAEAGDTIFVRGGVYRMPADRIDESAGIFAHVVKFNKSGAPDRRINYWAYPDERPVFDFSDVKPADQRVVAFNVTGSWIHIRGLEIVGVQVTIDRSTVSVCIENSGDNNIYERCVMRDGMALGFNLRRGFGNVILNCDAYRNWDSVSEGGRGGNVDGFGAHPNRTEHVGNVFRGCRAWLNSDDGFDCISSYAGITFENCWAFFNGYGPAFETRADGNGFKVGGYGARGGRYPAPVPRHSTRFCLAVGNKDNGFYANHHIGGGDWISNTAYRNGINYNFLTTLADNRTDVPGYGHLVRNNICFSPRSKSMVNLDSDKSDVSHNSFTSSMKLTAGDFVRVSTDNTELLALLSSPRQPDGSLPEISLLRPTAGGKLIDAGIDAGYPFRGKAPDLGAFESR